MDTSTTFASSFGNSPRPSSGRMFKKLRFLMIANSLQSTKDIPIRQTSLIERLGTTRYRMYRRLDIVPVVSIVGQNTNPLSWMDNVNEIAEPDRIFGFETFVRFSTAKRDLKK